MRRILALRGPGYYDFAAWLLGVVAGSKDTETETGALGLSDIVPRMSCMEKDLFCQ